MNNGIIDRVRDPEISGMRITVYDIWDYVRVGTVRNECARARLRRRG